jgi:hypothetical protein
MVNSDLYLEQVNAPWEQNICSLGNITDLEPRRGSMSDE